jgi:hypothetical protein
MVRNVARHLIPANGAYDLRDVLLDDDGAVYLRGGTQRLTTSQFGASITALWEAELLAGRKVLAAGSAGVATPDGAGGWTSLIGGVLSADGGGLAAVIGGMALFPVTVLGGTHFYAWAGETTVGAVIGGSSFPVNVTKGSATVTIGGGGSWAPYVKPGMFLAGSGGSTGIGLVKSVDSTTQLTLAFPWEFATQSMTGYAWSKSTIFGLNNTVTAALSEQAATVCGGRVLIARDRRVYLSNTIDPNTGLSRPWTFDVNDFHEFPAPVVALATLRDRVFVFTKAGIYVITGVALEIVDAFGNAQHRVERVSGDVILRSAAGLCAWRDSLVIAAASGIYVLDASGGLTLVSRAIGPLWTALVAAGSSMGQMATFRDHVFVPIDSGATQVDGYTARVLVGRLDRDVATPAGRSAPWTVLASGEARYIRSLAVSDPTGSAKLLAGTSASGYLLDATPLFIDGGLADVVAAQDSNASPIGMWVETREFLPGGGDDLSYLDRLWLDYESVGDGIQILVSKGEKASPGGAVSYASLATQPGQNYATSRPRAVAVRKSVRRTSFVFSTGGPVLGGPSPSSVRLRGFKVSTRDRGLQR